jgi:hypothetical protein
LDRATPEDYVGGLVGKYVDEGDYDLLISREDAEVLKWDGSPLIVFRHLVLPPDVCRRAYPALLRAARHGGSNRGTAAGGRDRPTKRDGTVSNTTRARYARGAKDGIIGYFDRTARLPFCRTTAFTREEVEGWAAVQPFVRAVNGVFRSECPERYRAQLAVAEKTPAEWVISGTAFTTITVNRNFRTAVHKDEGDLPEGFGVMSVLRAREYEGGFLCFPRYRVAVDMRTRDVLLADVHEWHGNTPLRGARGRYERISCVFYYRTGMRYCLPPAEELRHAKRRRPGDALFR